MNFLVKFYDTCALLDSGYSLLQTKEPIYISSVSLEELENIKISRNKDDSVKVKARKIVRILNQNEDKFKIIVYGEPQRVALEQVGLEITPDTKICATAYTLSLDMGTEFVTSDLCCKVIAKSIFGLYVSSPNETNEIYKGYKEITGTTEEINLYMNNLDHSDWNTNEYLIINNTDDASTKEMRYDGENFVALKLPPSKFVKGKNSLQRCALDILMSKNISVAAILGTYGSGKSFLCTKMALYHVLEKGNQAKILGVREIRGEGLAPGYLPGDLNDKTEFFFTPIAQQLDGGEFELEKYKQNGVMEFQIPYYLKGTTYDETVILVDEAEDLKESQIRLVGTRIGQNSRIFFSGDYKQSVLNSTVDNPLVKMCNEFKGKESFACICLDDDVRSEASKMFAELFQN